MSLIAPALRHLSAACLASAAVHAAPAGINLGFEDGLAGWSHAGVAVVPGSGQAGSMCLALQGGHIGQTFTGLTPGAVHTVKLAYLDGTPAEWVLSHARILIDGTAVGEIHNGQDNEYLDSGGFEFTAAGTTAALRIESLTTDGEGFLLDDIRIVEGGLPPPPEHAWNSLAAVADSRGGRRLANGSFEAATSDPDLDPCNSGPPGGPHLCGLSLPGWRVTRENVDIVGFSGANPPHGDNALDVGGHGPGGIAQTIAGLQPGAAYTFSFRYARHLYWGTDDMTGGVFANRRLVAAPVRTIQQTWEDGYGLMEIPVLASPEGKLTVEIRSTVTDQGGNILYDDFRLKEGGDGFLAWAVFHGVAADPEADDDGDTLANGFEFLFGGDPRSPTALPVVQGGTLRVPLSGLALAQGYGHALESSRDLVSWRAATGPGGGMMLLSDTSAAGVDGERAYAIDPAEPKLFWKHALALP